MYKIKEGCPGCGMCIKSCPVKAISIQDVSASISDKCINCGVCTYACPVKLIVKVDESVSSDTVKNQDTKKKSTASTASGNQSDTTASMDERKGDN